MLRHIAQKRGIHHDRHGRMTIADAGATWEVYTALGRLYRRDPEMAKALFPGIHGFVAESVAAGRFGWDDATPIYSAPPTAPLWPPPYGRPGRSAAEIRGPRASG